MNISQRYHTKVFAPARTQQHQQRQHAEVLLLKLLGDKPGLPAFVGSGYTPGGRMFVTYKRLPGVTLDEHLRAQKTTGSPPPSGSFDWLAFTESLLTCISKIHDHCPPIFHGDISARNVLLDDHGNVGLIDFGVARSRSLPFDLRFCSARSVAAPRFMSPEQARGSFWGSASDIYQAGLVALTYANREIPDASLSTEDILTRLRTDPGHARRQAAALSGFTGRFLCGLLNPKPNARPTAREALIMLRQARTVRTFTQTGPTAPSTGWT